MNILVTGGAGFIASNIADRFIELGHTVVIIDNLSSGKKEHINPKAIFYELDIRDKEINNVFENEKIDILCHHAAQIDVRKSVADPVYDADINIQGSLNLFEACKSNKIKKVIFASSGGAIYGDAEVLPTSEAYWPLKPTSPYGIAKLTIEYYLQYYYLVHHIPYIALRYSNVYGPRQDPFGEAGVVAIFINKILKNETPVINGDGEQVRDFVFVRDVVEANAKALESDFVGSINIGTSKQTTVNILFHELNSVMHTHLSETHGDAKLGEQRKSTLSIHKAHDVLGWSPQVTFSKGLEETVLYFKQKHETTR